VIKFVSDLQQVGGFLYTKLCDKVCQKIQLPIDHDHDGLKSLNSEGQYQQNEEPQTI
jgi:hypothetical protein